MADEDSAADDAIGRTRIGSDDGAEAARPPGGPPLGVLSQRVRDARAAVHEHRQGPVNSTDAVNARHRLLLALEAYIAALESRRLPVPTRSGPSAS